MTVLSLLRIIPLVVPWVRVGLLQPLFPGPFSVQTGQERPLDIVKANIHPYRLCVNFPIIIRHIIYIIIQMYFLALYDPCTVKPTNAKPNKSN